METHWNVHELEEWAGLSSFTARKQRYKNRISESRLVLSHHIAHRPSRPNLLMSSIMLIVKEFYYQIKAPSDNLAGASARKCYHKCWTLFGLRFCWSQWNVPNRVSMCDMCIVSDLDSDCPPPVSSAHPLAGRNTDQKGCEL